MGIFLNYFIKLNIKYFSYCYHYSFNKLLILNVMNLIYIYISHWGFKKKLFNEERIYSLRYKMILERFIFKYFM